MKTFKEFVMQEDNTAGAGGVFGNASSMGHGGDIGNTDFYAPGDMRIPFAFKIKGKNKKKKILVQRRNTFKYF